MGQRYLQPIQKYMEFDPHTMDQAEVYKLLIGCVVPRPIAWVSSCDAAGRANLAPFSFFNAAGSNPPTLTIAINHDTARPGERKDTLRNILETGEFVVNLVTEETAAAMNETATNYPSGIDEFAAAGLSAAPSRTVRPPRVGESPVSFECALHTSVPVGSGPGSTTIVVGIVRHFFIADRVLGERNHILLHELRPVGRLAGSAYAYVRETFDLVRKRYEP